LIKSVQAIPSRGIIGRIQSHECWGKNLQMQNGLGNTVTSTSYLGSRKGYVYMLDSPHYCYLVGMRLFLAET
jgi:hypothetical protein